MRLAHIIFCVFSGLLMSFELQAAGIQISSPYFYEILATMVLYAAASSAWVVHFDAKREGR